jgi:hypothetical protein
MPATSVVDANALVASIDVRLLDALITERASLLLHKPKQDRLGGRPSQADPERTTSSGLLRALALRTAKSPNRPPDPRARVPRGTPRHSRRWWVRVRPLPDIV